MVYNIGDIGKKWKTRNYGGGGYMPTNDPVSKINDGVYIMRDRVTAVVPMSSTISRRIRSSNQLGGKMINLTYGKECKTVVFINSGHSLLLAENAMEVKKMLWGE